jgi:hypothetical protein
MGVGTKGVPTLNPAPPARVEQRAFPLTENVQLRVHPIFEHVGMFLRIGHIGINVRFVALGEAMISVECQSWVAFGFWHMPHCGWRLSHDFTSVTY